MRKRKTINKCIAALIIFLIIAAVGLIAADAPDQERDAEPQIVEAVSAPAATTYKQEERDAKHYTDADAQALAQMAWGECRGVGDLVTADGRTVTGTCQKAAAMWVALNRYDAGYEESVVDVVAAPHQFAGYDPEHPLDDELLALAYDVLERWNEE